MNVTITDRDISDQRFFQHLFNDDMVVRVGEGHFGTRYDTQTMQRTPFKEQLNMVLNFDDPKTGPMYCWFVLRREALTEDATLGDLSDHNPIQVLIASEAVGRMLFNLYHSLRNRKVLPGELLTVEIYGDNNSWVMGGDMYNLSMQNKAPDRSVRYATQIESAPPVAQLTNLTAQRMLTTTLAQAEQALVASLQGARIGSESRKLIMKHYRTNTAEIFKKRTPPHE